MATPAIDLPRLAALAEAVASALGYKEHHLSQGWWRHPVTQRWDWLPEGLTSVDAAKALMPEGWDWSVEYRPRQNDYLAIASRTDGYQESSSTTEPQARTALALRCRAADLETRE